MPLPKIALRIATVLPPERKIEYISHPDWFVEEIIFNHSAAKFGGTMSMTDDQREILLALATNRRVGVKAGRGIGKTAVLSWLIIWWLCMFEGGQVAAFAPSFGQLNSVLWPEVAKWLKNSLVSEFFVHTATKVYLKEDPKNTFAEPRTASKEEAAQGLHADHLLILMDEAPGIEDKIWDVLQGSVTDENNKVVAMGNPARTSGFFFDAFHKDKKIWKCLGYSSANSPNVDQSWLDEMKLKYVHGDVIHDIYRVHVLGEFPSGDVTAFISLEDVDKAMTRTVQAGEPVSIGVDVARFGDDLTCIVIKRGNKFLDPIILAKSSIDLTVTTVLDAVRTLRDETGYSGIIPVKIDDTGVGGGVTDYLRLDRDMDLEVVPCNFGGAGNAQYANEASIMWGAFKDGLENFDLPTNNFLKEELATRKWELDSKGRIKIQPKSAFKKDYGSSPDHADAFILANANKKNDLLHIKSFDYVNDGLSFFSEELMMGGRFASVFQENSGRMSAVIATYTGSQLRVIDEYVGDSSDIIRVLGHYEPLEKTIGSKNMFQKESDDIFMQYTTNGIYLQESYGYDEFGAARHLEHLASINNFIVAKECTQVSTQLRTWTIDSETHQKKSKYGLCMALLHIVSELYMQNAITHDYDIESNYAPIEHMSDVNDGFLGM